VTSPGSARETFGSRFGALMTMIGVAVGLGNVWRFPYMVGKFGGAAFVLFYLIVVAAIGVPALMAEWTLGRHTRRGPVGAFALGGLPLGRGVGWLLFTVVTAAMAYYTAVIGWVLYYAVAEIARAAGLSVKAAAILPPEHGFDARSFVLQLVCTAMVVAACAVVVARGLRGGIERVSRIIMPVLLAILLVLVVRGLTLPGAGDGVRWYIGKFAASDLNARVLLAAMGQAIFSLSLGGTFMVVYGSYLDASTRLGRMAIMTAAGDTLAGLLAGLAIVPAVFALHREPGQGPGLIFSTLPDVFDALPAGWLFGLLFFVGLLGAAYLSDVAALEALVAGVTDNTNVSRKRAIWLMSAAVFVLSTPPSISMHVFVPWDLTFGSGMQTLGALLAVVTVGWCMNRSAALASLAATGESPVSRALYAWIRFGIPAAIIAVGVWWLLTSVLHTASGV
jgi:NSS family neurotransmitter:Na+ symporter